MCTKLLFDYAGKQYRTAKSIQAYQDNAENQIYSHRRQTNRPNEEWMTESRKSESNIPAIPNMVRDSVHENSQENTSSDPVQSPLPRLDLPQAAFDFSEDKEETAESLCTDDPALETPETNGQNTPHTPGSHKSTRKNFGKPASSFSDFYM